MEKILVLSLGLISLLLHNSIATRSNIITPSCDPADDICYLPPLVIQQLQTMMLYLPGSGRAYPVVEEGGQLFKKLNCQTGEMTPLTEEELPYVNTADGSYKYVTTINGEFPGPSMVVYEGQEVRVNFTNLIMQEGTGIHFHGVLQTGSNWMDGVPGLTQCSISAGETFTYRFTASPVGTHWYHSHYGLQRGDGLFGAFIVLPRPEQATDTMLEEPEYANDFIMMLHDFYPQTADQMFTSLYYKVSSYLYQKDDGCMNSTGRIEDGSRAGVYRLESAQVNGKGRSYDSAHNPVVLVPHEVYDVTQNNYYKFRVINAAKAYVFRVSIDGHPLVITHTEGGAIVHQSADSLVLNEGERYEFYIYTNQTVANYWIRVETLEKDDPDFTLAVLRYAGAPEDQDPTSEQRQCTTEDSCLAVNCPYRYLTNSECINVDDLMSQDQYQPSGVDAEYILHFNGVADAEGIFRSGINGLLFEHPHFPPAIHGYTKYDHLCEDCVTEAACKCTHQLQLTLGHTVQLTLFASGSYHPIHTHGFQFHVLKIGYPSYNDNNVMVNRTDDILCVNNDCNNAIWKDPSWNGGNIPGLNLDNPVLKDTVTIPKGGYVVIRFVVNNPGWWLLHCHRDTHFAEGMGLIIQAGTEQDMVPAPENFPLCGDIIWQDSYSTDETKNQEQEKELSNISPKKAVGTLPEDKTALYNQKLSELQALYEDLRIKGVSVPSFGEKIRTD